MSTQRTLTRNTTANVEHDDRGQNGSALILVLLVSLLLVGLGLSAMWAASSGTHITGSMTRRQEAMYAAEMGIERARARLAITNSWDNFLGSAAGGSCGATLDDPTGKGNVLCDGGTPIELASVASSTTAGQTPGLGRVTYTVFIRNDPAEAALPGGQFHDGDQRVVVRSEGRAQDGVSVVALEALLIVGGSGSPGAIPDYAQAGLNSQGSNSGHTAIAGP